MKNKKLIDLETFIRKNNNSSTKVMLNDRALMTKNRGFFVVIEETQVWKIKKALYSLLKIGVSQHELLYKTKVLGNKEFTCNYDFIHLRKKNRKETQKD